MRTFNTLIATTVALASTVAAADINGLFNALNGLNLTSLVGAVTTISNTTAGERLVRILSSNDPVTLLAPTNSAFSGVNPFFANDPVWLGQALAYHIIPGTVNIADIAKEPDNSVYATALTDPALVHLYGGKGQNIGLVRSGNNTFVTNQNDVPSRLLSTKKYKNVLIHKVSTVIDLPPAPADALGSSNYDWTANLTSLLSFAPPALVQSVTTSQSITLFAPTNQALVNAVNLGHIPPNLNGTALNALILNHIINGTVVFTGSPQTNYTSAGGEAITVGKGGAFGNVVYYRGQPVADIIHPDIIMQNGVLHIIDVVLPQLKQDEKAASSAFSVATKSATQTQAPPSKRTPSRFFRY